MAMSAAIRSRRGLDEGFASLMRKTRPYGPRRLRVEEMRSVNDGLRCCSSNLTVTTMRVEKGRGVYNE
jgi:hypothetical protein